MEYYDFVVIGGGAAGFFAAVNAAERNPKLKILILEKNREVLQKVKVSGGGRCNVTNKEEDPEKLIKNYPRGHVFLLKPFIDFGPKETKEWFNHRGVILKTESDGRVFPLSNTSQTILDFFLKKINELKISLRTTERVQDIIKSNDGWVLKTEKELNITTKKLMIASGSDARIWKMLENLEFNITEAVPSLFTFNIKDNQLKELQGVSFEKVSLRIKETKITDQGPILVTHWGVSGPAVLKLSAFSARELHKLDYYFTIEVNWLFDKNEKSVIEELKRLSTEIPKKNVINSPAFGIPQRFWKYICEKCEIGIHQKWAETGKKHFLVISKNLTACEYKVEGKSTFKEEFVTAGGIKLEEINPIDFSSIRYPSLYFAGEVLDIDAITGGFNFQAAWTGGWHVGKAI